MIPEKVAARIHAGGEPCRFVTQSDKEAFTKAARRWHSPCVSTLPVEVSMSDNRARRSDSIPVLAHTASAESKRPDPRFAERGMTLIEAVLVLWILSALSVISMGIVNGRIEKAKLARCFTDLRSIQSTVWTHSDGVSFPSEGYLWDFAWSGKKPGPYRYLLDNDDWNKGHGNDIDGCDEDNPGKSSKNRDCVDIEFVILCQHDHGNLAKYVYIRDEGPPRIAGWGGNDPGYERFLDRPDRGTGEPGAGAGDDSSDTGEQRKGGPKPK
jgi:type II secretory pathway pseudopilin PulG